MSGTAAPGAGVLGVLADASPNRKTEKICVNGKLQAEWDTLVAQLDQAFVDDATKGSLAAEHTTALLEQLEAIRDAIAASEVTFEFEQLGWTGRIALQSAHPPRKDNFVDQVRGYNVATYLPALIRGSCVAVVSAAGDRAETIPDDTWLGLLGRGEEGDEDYVKGTLNAKQVDKLLKAADLVNDGESRVPPSARSLLGSQDSGASLAQPSPGTSPRSGSEAGSRRGSRKSTGTKKAASSG